MFQRMIHDWFALVQPDYNDFVKAMLVGDVDAMNEYMNRIALQTFSYLIPETGLLGLNRSVFTMGLF